MKIEINIKEKFISILSLIISLSIFVYILICKGYIDFINFNVNAYGAMVSVLGILVAILIGWNIYSVIDTKNIIKKHEILKKRTTNEISRLKTLIEEQDAKKEKLSKYVNIVQNFTMANVRITEKKYGEALGIYCNAAIDIYKIIKDDESKWNEENDEIDLMCKCIKNAYGIVAQNKDIKNSHLLTNMNLSITKGLKEINYNKMNDVKTREKLNANTQEIIKAIEINYSNKDQK